MPKQQKNIFENANIAIQKIRNNRIIKAMILSALIISNSPLSAENIEQIESTPIEKFTNEELKISCAEEDIENAKLLKNIIDEIQLTNQYGEYLINEIAKNKTEIVITKTNGSNYYYNNTIYINSDDIKNATSTNKKQSLKESIAHEATHMLQNKAGIMNDIENLPPYEAISLYLLTELDATIKSYVACDNYYTTDTEQRMNTIFESISDVIGYAMNSYIQKAIYLNTNKDYNFTNKNPNDTISKFNKIGNFPKLHLDGIIENIYNKIPNEYKKQIDKLNNDYITKGNTILNQTKVAQK